MQERLRDDDDERGDGLVACLCADWCGSCRDYRDTFERVARDRPGWRFVWIDIEDESDALAAFDLDIESFPTLLIAREGELRFLGGLLPHAATLLRTLDAARRAGLQTPTPTPAQAQRLIARVRTIGRTVV